jgi:hypothetical protein
MKRYQIYLYGSELSSRVIGLEGDLLFLLEDNKRCLIGAGVATTRKGFYYSDIFFKRNFVSWSSLKKLD